VYGDIVCSTILLDYGASIIGNIETKENQIKTSIIEHEFSGSSSEMKSTALETTTSTSEPILPVAVQDVVVETTGPTTIASQKVFQVVLLVLEPQIDFYAADDTAQHESAQSLASFIDNHWSSIDEILVALDSHQVSKLRDSICLHYFLLTNYNCLQGISISSSSFWINKHGDHPPVGTLITMLDLQDGMHWKPRKEDSMVIFFDDNLMHDDYMLTTTASVNVYESRTTV